MSDLPRLSAPARRALANAGIATLDDLVKHSERQIASLHGMGPKALGLLRDAMGTRKLRFAGDAGVDSHIPPAPGHAAPAHRETP